MDFITATIVTAVQILFCHSAYFTRANREYRTCSKGHDIHIHSHFVILHSLRTRKEPRAPASRRLPPVARGPRSRRHTCDTRAPVSDYIYPSLFTI
ncbi:unnamed protein product [Arctia plantaginis]|uniref:Uncharacterized protein n=1 Tax=Arctia plantaginis TaxID=874455 RepID=A0A8S1ABS1_ARCPL|nr:unnamed protein product [Arctia plantaginis]